MVKYFAAWKQNIQIEFHGKKIATASLRASPGQIIFHCTSLMMMIPGLMIMILNMECERYNQHLPVSAPMRIYPSLSMASFFAHI
jgi:hypothetical protein